MEFISDMFVVDNLLIDIGNYLGYVDFGIFGFRFGYDERCVVFVEIFGVVVIGSLMDSV